MTLSCVIIQCDVGLCERVDVGGHKSVYENAHGPGVELQLIHLSPWMLITFSVKCVNMSMEMI